MNLAKKRVKLQIIKIKKLGLLFYSFSCPTDAVVEAWSRVKALVVFLLSSVRKDECLSYGCSGLYCFCFHPPSGGKVWSPIYKQRRNVIMVILLAWEDGQHFLLVQNPKHYLCLAKREYYTLRAEFIASSKLALTLKAALGYDSPSGLSAWEIGFLPLSSFV